MSMQITRVEGGLYEVDGRAYDLGTLVMMVGFERAETIENQIVSQVEQMKRRNEYIQTLTKAMADVQGWVNDHKEGDCCFHATDHTYTVGDEEKSLKEIFEDDPGLGLSEWDYDQDGHWNWKECQTAIDLMKGRIDALNSESQLDMIRLQSLMSKRDNIYQSISNLMKTDQKSKDTAISNLR